MTSKHAKIQRNTLKELEIEDERNHHKMVRYHRLVSELDFHVSCYLSHNMLSFRKRTAKVACRKSWNIEDLHMIKVRRRKKQEKPGVSLAPSSPEGLNLVPTQGENHISRCLFCFKSSPVAFFSQIPNSVQGLNC
ncbi:hypothetical protein TRIUR3_32089 [Triticum urartu]|uniref:Uncharacterized protein n=1 Tax=Triticum urartu TaxID=4572 RepID=M7ZC13_TRIUA|nr:hypothetical protein TRIUR3_32089 [Triticum urartu]